MERRQNLSAQITNEERLAQEPAIRKLGWNARGAIASVEDSLVLAIFGRRIWQFAIERLPVSHAAAQELRPGRDGNLRLDALWQQSPELGMMPAELMPAAIPMLPDPRPETLDLPDQLRARKSL